MFVNRNIFKLPIIIIINIFFANIYFKSGDFIQYQTYYALFLDSNSIFQAFLNIRITEPVFAIISLVFSNLFGELTAYLIPALSSLILLNYHYKTIKHNSDQVLIWIIFSFFLNYAICFHLQRQFLSLSFFIIAIQSQTKKSAIFFTIISILTHNISVILVSIFFLSNYLKSKNPLSFFFLFASIWGGTILAGNLGLHFGGVESLSTQSIILITFISLISKNLRWIMIGLLVFNFLNPYLATRLWYSILFLYFPKIIQVLEVSLIRIPRTKLQ